MKLNPSIKLHLIIGALLSIWSLLFTLSTRPYEHGEMDLRRWYEVAIGFSVIAFFSYAIISWIQKALFLKFKKWNFILEISIYIIFYSLYTIATYFYYRSPIITGFYNFQEFFSNIIINIIAVFTPIVLIARHYVTKLIPKKSGEIIIKGTNKLDYLKIKQSELICISNSQNYVEVFFLEKDIVKTKLIRSSLKKVHADFDFLIQIHRSHLINPLHFKSWKDTTTILVSEKELPVSKSYKKNLLNL